MVVTNDDDNDDNEENEDRNNGKGDIFAVIDVDTDFKDTGGKEAVDDNCNDKGNGESVGEEGFGTAAGLMSVVAGLVFVVVEDADDDDDDVDKNNDKSVVCNEVNVDKDAVVIRNVS